MADIGQVEAKNERLNKYRIFQGSDVHVLQQKAASSKVVSAIHFLF